MVNHAMMNKMAKITDTSCICLAGSLARVEDTIKNPDEDRLRIIN